MSRSGYNEDCVNYAGINLYRANVDRALAGKRGQAFLRELITALDALPEKKLIAESFSKADGVCALGSVARMRGVVDKLPDPEMCDEYEVGECAARVLGIAECMAREIMWENDDCYSVETEEQRWKRVRSWATKQINRKEET